MIMKREKAKKKTPTYCVTAKGIENYRQQGRDEAMRNSVVFLFYLTYLMLRDEFGFGKTRMMRAMRKIGTLIGDMNEDWFTLVDCQAILKAELGIDISETRIFIPDEKKAVSGHGVR